LEAKVKIGEYFRGVKCNFPFFKIKKLKKKLKEEEEEQWVIDPPHKGLLATH
jgi:hypothetical protein